jgi:RND family efflux transporter MFP subunit
MLVSSGCRHGISAPKGGSDTPPSKTNLARRITMSHLERRDLTYSVETVGTLEAYQETKIAAGVAGIVDEVHFEPGDIADPQKTILVKIDQQKFEASAALALANEERAKSRLKLAEDQLTRISGLRRQASSSEQELIQARMDTEMAKAELQSATAAKRLADLNLEKSRVRVPYLGQINERSVAVGDYVKEDTPIGKIADLSKLRLRTFIPELAAPRVKAGDTIQFTLEALPGKTYSAKIIFLSTVADSETHMFECKADVTPIEPGMRPGLFARVTISVEQRPNAVVAPEESVRASERGFVIFVPMFTTNAEGSKAIHAEEYLVTPGFRRPGIVEILSMKKVGSDAPIDIQPGLPVAVKGAESLINNVPLEIVDDAGKPISTPALPTQEKAVGPKKSSEPARKPTNASAKSPMKK